MDTLVQDIRYAARTLARRPGFTAAIVLSLALGIGANTAIFSFVNAVLLRPLPFTKPEELTVLWTRLPAFGREVSSYPDVADWRVQNSVFSEMAAYANSNDNIALRVGEPDRVASARVSTNFFATLGVRVARGRDFQPGDSVFGAHRVAILSHDFWTRRMNGDTTVVGTTISLGGTAYEIVGIAPPGVALPERVQLWTPFALNPANPRPGRRGDFLHVVARLRDGASIDRAQANMDAIAARLSTEYPAANDRVGVDVVGLRDELVGSVRRALLVVAAAVGLVLLIACANIANLLLARATARSREMAVRVAIGARRQRLVRQLLTESTMLALIGGTLGVIVAVAGVAALKASAPPDLPRLDSVGIDLATLGFAATLSLLTGMLFGVAPALQASAASPAAALNAGGRSGIGGLANRVRQGLVLAQVAIALALLAGSGLLLRSLINLQRVDLGFEPGGVLTAQIFLPPARYREMERAKQFFEALRSRIASEPGVRTVGLATDVPLGAGFNYLTVSYEGRPPAGPGQNAPDAVIVSADTGYFRALGIRLVEGRLFGRADGETGPRVAVVNEELVRRHFDGRSPIGQRLTNNPGDSTTWATIVGVIATTRLEGVGRESYPQIIFPLSQNGGRGAYVLVRADRDLAAIETALRRAVVALDPLQPLADVRTMEQRVATSIAQPRLTSGLMATFAAAALLLAGVGIWSVIAYTVVQRTREIGIRIALGASRGQVLGWILRGGMTPVALGAAVGFGVALFASRQLGELLFGVSPRDPVVFGGVTALLLAVAAAACFLPARRAIRVDPTTALRQE